MVKPGGTGSPMRHISARFAPLPPSSGFIWPLPSVFLPNKYTNLPDFLPAVALAEAVGRPAFLGVDVLRARLLLAITSAVLLSCPMSDVRYPIPDIRYPISDIRWSMVEPVSCGPDLQVRLGAS